MRELKSTEIRSNRTSHHFYGHFYTNAYQSFVIEPTMHVIEKACAKIKFSVVGKISFIWYWYRIVLYWRSISRYTNLKKKVITTTATIILEAPTNQRKRQLQQQYHHLKYQYLKSITKQSNGFHYFEPKMDYGHWADMPL